MVAPAAPTNIVATETFADKVNLHLTKSVGANDYQFYRDGAALGWIGDIDTYDDVGADPPVISAVDSIVSRDRYFKVVGLDLEAITFTNGTTHTYKAKARNAGMEESGFSTTDTGYRLADENVITFQWQKSAADSDAAFADILGATVKEFYDRSAPVHPAGRYYKCKLNATGAAQVISTPARGYLRDPLLPDTQDNVTVVIKNPDGNVLGYATRAYNIGTDYLVNTLGQLKFSVPADSQVRDYLVYPNEAWLYSNGDLKNGFKIVKVSKIR